MLYENATWYLPCMCQWLSNIAPTMYATGTYHRRDVYVLIVCLSEYRTVQVPSGRTGGEVHQYGVSDPQTPAHNPHCYSEWAGQSNGDGSWSGTTNTQIYTQGQNRTYCIILRHWSCDLITRNSAEHAGFTLALLPGSHHTTLAIICC